jgi:hypothetical protein
MGGIPKTVALLTQEDVLWLLNEVALPRQQAPSQRGLACACGYSRPVIESLMANLLCRGTTRLTYKGHPVALEQIATAVVAHAATSLVRVYQQRLAKRAHNLHRLLRLRCGKSDGAVVH